MDNMFNMSGRDQTAEGYRTTLTSLQPGDHYAVRICDPSLDAASPLAEQICDDMYGESGEFDVTSSLLMNEPACGTAYSAPAHIQATWSNYYVAGGTKMNVEVLTGGNVVIFTDHDVANTGYYNFYASHDMPTGDYYFRVTVSCGVADCSNYWIGEGFDITGQGCRFSVTAAASPPSPPKYTGAFEIPIIKTFESGYSSFGGAAYTASTGEIVRNDDHSNLKCAELCYAGQGRRLLFGGLGSLNGQPGNGYLPSQMDCSPEQAACNCKFCPSYVER